MSSSESWGMLDDQRVTNSRAIFEKYAEGSAPKDRFVKERWAMASVHAIVFNAIEAVYKNATHIASNDFETFYEVAKDTLSGLEVHHSNEETIYFPFFEKFISMEGNRQQHQGFLTEVHATLDYLESVSPKLPNPTAFSPVKFRELLDAFLPVAAQHMADELSTLDPDLLREHMPAAALDAAEKAVMDHTMATVDQSKFLPGLFYSRPANCGFPQVPWFVSRLLVPLLAFINRRSVKYYWSERRWEKTPAMPPS